MSAENLKSASDKNRPKGSEAKPATAGAATATASATPATTPAKSAQPVPKMPPLFRKVDWITFGITSVLAFIGFFLTIAPEVTLQDSGELATGSYYAGVPHPPGYPLWTIVTWVFTVLVPVGNVAYRVAIASAVSGALASGMLAFLTSRGCSMVIESLPELRGIQRGIENWICMVAGFVAGMLMAFNGFMWSQSNIVEVYPFSVLSFMGVMVCLLKWVYAPHQKRYLYLAWFLFGVCFTNHQTLILAATGVEVVILAAKPKLGRDLLLINTLCYVLGVFGLLTNSLGAFSMSQMVQYIFHGVGIGSLMGCTAISLWEYSNPKPTPQKFTTEILMPAISIGLALLVAVFAFLLQMTGLAAVAFLSIIGVWVYYWWKYKSETLSALGMMSLWLVGAAIYFYMPLTSMSNPPMNWGYARTWDGFIHAFTRGQYERIAPTNDINRLFMQAHMYLSGATEELNPVCLALALLPFAFFLRFQKRERAWLIGLSAIWVCLSMLLMIMLNPNPDKSSVNLNKVFFAASYTVVCILIGYALALIAAFMVTNYEKFRRWGIAGGVVALALASRALVDAVIGQKAELNVNLSAVLSHLHVAQIWLEVLWVGAAAYYVYMLTTGGEASASVYRLGGIALVGSQVVIATIDEIVSISTLGWGKFFHSIAATFTPNHFGLFIQAGLILIGLVVLFIMLLAASKVKPLTTVALGLFALLPMYSIMSHWFDNEQRGHWFGYWFGHDMFTPPFFLPDGKASYDAKLREQAMKGPNGNLVYPEMARDAILFGGTDPGRFCPTYMIFCDSQTPGNKLPEQDQHFDRRDVYIITQNALADGTYLEYIRAHYFRSAQKDPPFFQEMLRSSKEKEQNYKTNFVARIAGNLLDRPFESLGAKIEARRRAEGIYPPKEIYTPSPDDSQQCFQEYLADAQRRLDHDARLEHDLTRPNEPKLLRPGEDPNRELKQGEDVHVIDQRVQVQGQVAVMSINGLLTKVIFDHNPTNEFYVEESFPLDWMYPYLTPFGVIMKINRQPLAELPDDVVKRDHEFWSAYSQRLVGNWITYETSIKEIADFVEKVYLDKDYSNFKGDRKFMRDDDAQKAFSKLRSSIGGVYNYRVATAKSVPEQQKMIKEADFAFKQAFAYCPYSPEAVFRYVQLLATFNRIDDAILVAETCHKVDPNNASVETLIGQLKGIKAQHAGGASVPIAGSQPAMEQLEKVAAENPNDFQAEFNLASAYLQSQQKEKAMQVLDKVMANPNVNKDAVIFIVKACAEFGELSRLENALDKLTKMEPDSPEAWYDLAAMKATLGKSDDAVKDLRQSVQCNSKRLAQDPKASNLLLTAQKDTRFDKLRQTPEVQQLLGLK